MMSQTIATRMPNGSKRQCANCPNELEPGAPCALNEHGAECHVRCPSPANTRGKSTSSLGTVPPAATRGIPAPEGFAIPVPEGFVARAPFDWPAFAAAMQAGEEQKPDAAKSGSGHLVVHI